MNLEKLEQIERQNLQVAEVIPFDSFREKIKLTQKYKDCKVIDDKYIYIARCRYE